MGTDFWDDAANEDVPEPPKPSFDGIPDGLNVIARTCDQTDKPTVQPSIKPIESATGAFETFYKFKSPMVVVGGEAKLDPKFVGRYVFVEFNVEKPTVERLNKSIATASANGNDATVKRLEGQLGALDKYPCAPELYNLILDTLAPAPGTAAERWVIARAMLGGMGKAKGYTLEACNGNSQYLYALAFKDLLLAQSYQVIGKTYTPKQREGSTFEPQQTLGSIGSYTEDEAKKRKVKLMDNPNVKEGF
jgi:hypothetical protein